MKSFYTFFFNIVPLDNIQAWHLMVPFVPRYTIQRYADLCCRIG